MVFSSVVNVNVDQDHNPNTTDLLPLAIGFWIHVKLGENTY